MADIAPARRPAPGRAVQCQQCGFFIGSGAGPLPDAEDEAPVRCMNCGLWYCRDCLPAPAGEAEALCFACQESWRNNWPGADPLF